jgi:hypothetical protein
MLTTLTDLFTQASKWSNDNQGVVSIGIFVVTMGFGWISGIFSTLRRKPKFKISLIDGPTFCCTYLIGKIKGEHEMHRTGIALYLAVTNTGSAASSIGNISVGYHWHIHPFSLDWLRYSVGWFWLHDQVAALTDFQAKIGENTKVFPFLTQKNHSTSLDVETYLQPGQSTNGVVYFEQSDSWGECFPSPRKGDIPIKVAIEDAFGKKHYAKFKIASVTMEYARMYNPSFGKTLAELNDEQLPFDTSI